MISSTITLQTDAFGRRIFMKSYLYLKQFSSKEAT